MIPTIAKIYARLASSRSCVVKNLQALEPGARVSPASVDRIYDHFAFSLYEFFSGRRFDVRCGSPEFDSMPEYLRSRLGPTGAGQESRLLLGAHLGNWEIGMRTIVENGYRMSAIALGHSHPGIDQLFGELRRHPNLEMIDLGCGLRPFLRAIQQGRMLALVCDRDYTGNGVPVRMGEHQVFFPSGPARLYLQTKTPAVLCHALRESPDHFRFEVDPLDLDAFELKNVPGHVAVSQLIADRLLDIIHRHREQWGTFYDYFTPG